MTYRLALASLTNAAVTVVAQDQFALGSSASNIFDLVGTFTNKVIIDGSGQAAGGRGDIVALGGDPNDWSRVQQTDGHFDLSFDGSLVAELWRVETLVFRDAYGFTPLQRLAPGAEAAQAPIIPVVRLDGSAVVGQIVAAGNTDVQVSSTADYSDIGDGNRVITGTAGLDFILLGAGTQVVVAGAGNDIVNAMRGQLTSAYSITGGGGNDYIGANGMATVIAVYSGNLADYFGVLDPDGRLVLADIRAGSADGTDTLSGVTQLQFADQSIGYAQYVEQFVPVIYFGTSAADGFAPVMVQKVFAYGLDGDDQLTGASKDDTLDGGTGTDSLYGLAGNDTFVVDSQSDLIFENAGEGIDTAISTANCYLYANVENLTLAAGAGDRLGWATNWPTLSQATRARTC